MPRLKISARLPNKLTLLSWIAPGVVIALLLAGFGLRLLDLTDPPLDFHPARQLRAAIIARGMYAQMDTESFDPEQRQTAIDMWWSMAVYEPQIFERIVALTYSLAGSEALWVARVYSASIWVLGGIALFQLARRAASYYGGIIALAFYLFLPFAVSASRSFQPDPWMVSLVVWAAYLAYRWSEEKSWRLAILTGLFAGLAVLIKAPAAFQIGWVLLLTVLTGWGLKKAVTAPQVWLAAGLSIIIPALFYLRGSSSGGYLGFWSASLTRMLLEPGFYVRWLVFLQQNVVEISVFFAGIAGAALYTARGRAIALGLWLGYGCYGLVLPYLISTHDYYSLPLVPTIAFSLAPLASPIHRALSHQNRLWQDFFYLALVIALAFPAWISRSALLGSDYRQEILGWQAMGRDLPTDRPIIAIIHDYGHRLRYYGWVAVDLWPSTADQKLASLRGEDSSDASTLFAELTKGYGYFLVTQPKELQAQPQLSEILYNHYPLISDNNGYLLFDLR